MAIMVLIMSWESGRMDAAVAQGDIPQESIRLRILANSDSPSDQLIKRVVRDEVVAAMNGWAAGLQSVEEARSTIEARMPELERIVADTLASRGFAYDSSAQLGLVEFPTKMYGSKVYPAGQYEALLITIGEGKGQNWWCVLFPPLCFIDAVSGEASAASADQAAAPSQAGAAAGGETAANSSVVEGKGATDVEQANGVVKDGGKTSAGAAKNESAAAAAPQAKFFLWEMIQKLIDWIKSLF